MGIGVIEFAVLAFMFASSGGYGVPVGIAPGVEDPYLHQIAPENCLMYASWSGTAGLNPENPTEKLLAQEEIQGFLTKLKKQCELAGKDVEGLDASRKAYREMVARLPELALTQPCCFYVDGVQWMDDRHVPKFSGALVVRLDDDKDEIQKLVNSIVDVPDYEDDQLGGFVDFLGLGLWDSVRNRKFEVQGDYLVLAFGGDAMEVAPEKVAEYAKKGEPQWLKDLKNELAVERRSSVSMFNMEKINELLEAPNNSDMFRGLEGLGLKSIKRIGWVSGLDETGFICRTSVVCEEELEGALEVIDLPPLEAANLQGVGNRDFIFASKLSAERLYSIVDDLASSVGESDGFDSMIAEFEAFSGISLKDDLIADLDEYFYIYGDFTMADFGRSWVVGIGIRDPMSFSETLANFNTRIAEVIEESETLELEVEDFNGVEIHTAKDVNDRFGWFTNPSWARVGSQLIISFKAEAIKKHITEMEDGSAYTDSVQGKRLFQFAKDQEIEGPIAIMNVDWKKILKLIEPFLGGAGDFEVIPELDIRFDDIPKVDVLVNGIEPSITGVYRTKNGFQIYQQQVQPSGSPVATVAFSAVVSFLLRELEYDY